MEFSSRDGLRKVCAKFVMTRQHGLACDVFESRQHAAESVAATTLEQQHVQVSEPCAEARWQHRRLPNLTECLHKVVTMQMPDLRRTLYSHGNFEVSPPFGKFVVAESVCVH